MNNAQTGRTARRRRNRQRRNERRAANAAPPNGSRQVGSLLQRLERLSVAGPSVPPTTRNAGNTRNARRRRRRAAGGTGIPGSEIAQAAPAIAYGGVIRNTAPPMVISVSGTDWIDTEAVTTTSPDGTIIALVDVTPSSFPGTHLNQVSRGFERYKFVALNAIVTARAPTTVGGGYLAGFTPDVYQTPGKNSANKRYVRALFGSVSAPWWQTTTVTADLRQSEPFYYTQSRGSEAFKKVQQRFWLVIDGPPTGVTGKIMLTIQFYWTVHLSVPAVEIDSPPFFLVPSGSPVKLFSATAYPGAIWAEEAWRAASQAAKHGQPYICDPPMHHVADKVVAAVRFGDNPSGPIVYGYETVSSATRAWQAATIDGDVKWREGVTRADVTLMAIGVPEDPRMRVSYSGLFVPSGSTRSSKRVRSFATLDLTDDEDSAGEPGNSSGPTERSG